MSKTMGEPNAKFDSDVMTVLLRRFMYVVVAFGGAFLSWLLFVTWQASYWKAEIDGFVGKNGITKDVRALATSLQELREAGRDMHDCLNGQMSELRSDQAGLHARVLVLESRMPKLDAAPSR